MTFNQDWVLARWREDRAKDDPELYAVELHCGHQCVWASINGNVGWYYLDHGRLYSLARFDVTKHAGSKQRRKIAGLLLQ